MADDPRGIGHAIVEIVATDHQVYASDLPLGFLQSGIWTVTSPRTRATHPNLSSGPAFMISSVNSSFSVFSLRWSLPERILTRSVPQIASVQSWRSCNPFWIAETRMVVPAATSKDRPGGKKVTLGNHRRRYQVGRIFSQGN